MANMTYSVTIVADSDRLTATVTGEDRQAVGQAVRDWAIASYGSQWERQHAAVPSSAAPETATP